ncbi:MAG: hypothetical protein RLN62_06395 [Rickettsiales bacterium]
MKSLFLLILSISLNCKAFTVNSENDKFKCSHFIRGLAINHNTVSTREIIKAIGDGKESLTEAHTYSWDYADNDRDVVFVNNKYVYHTGDEIKLDGYNIDYHDLTPEIAIKILGRPTIVLKSSLTTKQWQCNYSESNLEVIFDGLRRPARYQGKFCLVHKYGSCMQFAFTSHNLKNLTS